METEKGETDTNRKVKLASELKLAKSLEVEWSPHLTEDRKSTIWTEIKKTVNNNKCLQNETCVHPRHPKHVLSAK